MDKSKIENLEVGDRIMLQYAYGYDKFKVIAKHKHTVVAIMAYYNIVRDIDNRSWYYLYTPWYIRLKKWVFRSKPKGRKTVVKVTGRA